MIDLEAGYSKFGDIRKLRMDKVAAVEVEKATALEQLKSVAEQEAKLQKEVFHLADDLASSGAELNLARKAILALESQVKSKKHSIHRLRRE